MDKARQSCASCHEFLPREDPHVHCIICRPCSQDQPFDKDWPTELWESFLAKRNERMAKRKAARELKSGGNAPPKKKAKRKSVPIQSKPKSKASVSSGSLVSHRPQSPAAPPSSSLEVVMHSGSEHTRSPSRVVTAEVHSQQSLDSIHSQRL